MTTNRTGTPQADPIDAFTEWLTSIDLRILLDIIGVIVGTLLALAAGYWLLSRALPRSFPIAHSLAERLGGIRVQKLTLLSSKQLGALFVSALQVVRLLGAIGVVFILVPLVWALFPETQGTARELLTRVLYPFRVLWTGFVDNLDNLLFLAVIVVVTRFLILALRKIFVAIGQEQIVFKGFDAEWATVTYQLTRFVVVALAVVIAYPYIPGSDSAAFQGVSVFLGILMSIGSSSAMANIVAGTLLVYMRPFSIGDRVKIADTVGDVVDRDLLTTRIRTIKNVEVTIPNATILGNHIVNYSASSLERGLILHTAVTIGYDVPWREVHAALMSAAASTADVLATPEPFVLQTDLGDFSVRYELNAYTHRAGAMARIYSELHQNIQDHFSTAEIEILSPHYTALRDGRPSTIPSRAET